MSQLHVLSETALEEVAACEGKCRIVNRVSKVSRDRLEGGCSRDAQATFAKTARS